MDNEELLRCLQQHVEHGEITTYRNLSVWAYGHRLGTQSISAMLKAAVRRGPNNSTWTNRVVGHNGSIQNVNGQLDQLLLRESVPIRDRRVLMQQATVIQPEPGA